MQNEREMRNSHTQDMYGKWEKPTSYFCLAVDTFGEKQIHSEEQQAAGTHKGTVGRGRVDVWWAREMKDRTALEGEQSPYGAKEEAGEATGALP